MKPRYKIKEFRKELNMSQEELANKAGISRATLSKLESGRIVEVSTNTLFKIADALGKKANEIFLA
ncbi:MAG: helix-turn-helix transcriptional regulator [Mogibacterium diversum]|nr:helix-turn-helix transcriptional regulator [Mogibacterium diversum]